MQVFYFCSVSVEWKCNVNAKAISKWIPDSSSSSFLQVPRNIAWLPHKPTTTNISHKIHYNFPTKAFHVYANVERVCPFPWFLVLWAFDSYR
jgi:hypothetical protein